MVSPSSHRGLSPKQLATGARSSLGVSIGAGRRGEDGKGDVLAIGCIQHVEDGDGCLDTVGLEMINHGS